jgi:hypothetical protein
VKPDIAHSFKAELLGELVRAALIMAVVTPRFAIYNWLNPWGCQRENPEAPQQTFRSRYIEHRSRP